jgi:hypothetical protein
MVMIGGSGEHITAYNYNRRPKPSPSESWA